MYNVVFTQTNVIWVWKDLEGFRKAMIDDRCCFCGIWWGIRVM